MYTEEEISSAIKAGVISEDAASALRKHVEKLRSESAVDEEYFRLITSFNDIFVTIACLLLLIAIEQIGSTFTSWFGSLLLSIAAWFLAEFFTLKRRMALPSIVLLLIFVGGVFSTGYYLVDMLSGKISAPLIFAVSAVTTVAAWLHWLRFHVPITVAAGVAAGISCVIALFFSVIDASRHMVSLMLFISGMTVFILAMRWDAKDIKRQTMRSDVAFWLHLLAAPLLVHPVFTTLDMLGTHVTIWKTIIAVGFYIIIAIVSLCIDRRALMVSSLAYIVYMLSALLNQSGFVSMSFAFTAFIIGSALLVLAAYWQPSRAYFVQRLPRVMRERLS